MKDTKKLVDNIIEIDFKTTFLRFESIKYRSSINH